MTLKLTKTLKSSTKVPRGPISTGGFCSGEFTLDLEERSMYCVCAKPDQTPDEQEAYDLISKASHLNVAMKKSCLTKSSWEEALIILEKMIGVLKKTKPRSRVREHLIYSFKMLSEDLSELDFHIFWKNNK